MLTQEQREILEHLTRIWTMYPSLRFGQLIGNVMPGDRYYATDKDTLSLFEHYERSVMHE